MIPTCFRVKGEPYWMHTFTAYTIKKRDINVGTESMDWNTFIASGFCEIMWKSSFQETWSPPGDKEVVLVMQ